MHGRQSLERLGEVKRQGRGDSATIPSTNARQGLRVIAPELTVGQRQAHFSQAGHSFSFGA